MAHCWFGFVDMVSAACPTKTFKSDLSLPTNRCTAGVILYCLDCGFDKLRSGPSEGRRIHKTIPTRVGLHLHRGRGVSGIVLRAFETDGRDAQTSVDFLGRKQRIREVNLLEEQTGADDEATWRLKPYEISTVYMSMK